MSTSVVTGGAGFLGSHLCTSLLDQGHEVMALDNLYTGSLRNLEHIKNNPKFSFVEEDVTNKLHFEVDGIFNFACAASPAHYQARPVETLKASVHGSINVLDIATERNIRVLHSSTSEVYGDPKVSPQVEEYWGNVNPVGPRGCYDEAKRFMEALTMAYHDAHGLETRIVRIFNTYGPRMRLNDGRVLPAFIGQALRGEDLTMFGDGSQTRSFCYVDDLVEGIYRLLLSDYHMPVNVGNPSEITIKEFGEEILKLTGAKQKLISKPLPKDDPKQRRPDITKAKEILGWEPKVSRAEGLKITYDYFKSLSKDDLNKVEHKSFDGFVK